MKVNVINQSKHELPAYQTISAAGLDLRANIEDPINLRPMQRILVPTGLFMELPEGFEAQIRPRSGLAYKFGVTVLNSPGTIDADYRGEIKILLVNLSEEPFLIENGERVAQMVIAKHEQISWNPVEKLEDSDRSAGGFGSTGKQ